MDRAEYEFGEGAGHILEHADDQGPAIAGADCLIALTRNEADLLVHYYPESGNRIRIVGNGIDDSEEACRAARRMRSEEPLLVLYTGQLAERKGIRDLLAAIPTVLEKVPDTRFLLAGGPAGWNAADLPWQWLPSECLPFADRIHFTGWLTTQEVDEWYRRADIQVIPSRYEPFGMVVLEVMLHGPADHRHERRRTGGHPRGWAHRFADTPFNPEALAGALLRLLNNPELRRRLGAEAAAEVRGMWLWTQIAEKMRAVYLETVAQVAGSARRLTPRHG